MSKYWEPCPRCGSSSVITRGKWFWFLVLFCSGGCMIWLGLIFVPFLFLAFLLILISPLSFLLPKLNQCQECKFAWKVKKKSVKNGNNSGINKTAVEKTTIENILENEPLTKPQHTESAQNMILFNVAGVTFENDEGKDIQSLLRKIGKQIARDNDIPSYSGLTNSEILEGFEEISEFEEIEFGECIVFEKDPDNEFDKNAIKVFVKLDENKKHHIGYVPKENNIELLKIMDAGTINDVVATFVGGKIKEVDYDFEKDKEVVVVKELTLGVEIKVYYK